MRRGIAGLFLLVTLGSVAGAQNVTPVVSPAERILSLRSALRLDTAQTTRLRELARGQMTALGKATTAFLRAEADLVDASRGSDASVRRTAIEKRSRAAIDGEMIRLSADKEARAILTSNQLNMLDLLLTEADDASMRSRPIWDSQVAPIPLNAVPFATPDSGNIRIAVTPLTTEIWIGDRSVGFGRVAMRLPVGSYMLRFRGTGCIDSLAVRIEKGPRPAITHRMSC